MFPPVPDFDALHPLVVHFPVALLLVAPLLVVLALAVPRHRAGIFLAAFVLMLLGTIAAYVAVESGEAGAMLVEQTPEIAPVLHEHAEMAGWVRLVFTVLTVLFGLLVLGSTVVRRPMPKWVIPASYAVFLVLYAAGALLVANTAHRGGLLVHRYGVHAMFESALPGAPGK